LAELEVVELPGTAEMLDVDAEDSVVPRPILAHIVDWISRRQLDPPAPPRPAPVLATETTEFVGGARLTHRLVRIGGHGLFGVQTTREGNDGAKAVLMLNNGVAPNIGPGRQWIEWGPDWTSAGYTVLRIDMSGLGDSPARDPREEQIVYSRAVDLDLADAVAYLRTAGATHVVTVGLCSGAVFGLRALGAGVGIDAVVAINPGLHSPVAYYRTDLRRGYYRTPVRIAAFPLSKTPLFGLFERIPTWIWRVLDHLRLVRSPVRLPLNAARAGVPALIIFGQKEWALRALRRRDPKGAAALVNSSTVTVTVIEGLDHSMFAVTARDDVRALVREWTDKVMQ
jgi:pimeloyl-ACP methyl ester carboxylesterase